MFAFKLQADARGGFAAYDEIERLYRAGAGAFVPSCRREYPVTRTVVWIDDRTGLEYEERLDILVPADELDLEEIDALSADLRAAALLDLPEHQRAEAMATMATAEAA